MHPRTYRPIQLFQQQLEIYPPPQTIMFVEHIVDKLYPKHLYILALLYAVCVDVELVHQRLFLELYCCTGTVSQHYAAEDKLHQVNSFRSVAGNEKLDEVVEGKTQQ